MKSPGHKLAAKWVLGVLVAVGVLLVYHGGVLGTNPIGGITHSFVGAVDVAAASDDVHALSIGDLDNDGYFDLVYGAGVTLAVIENDGTPFGDWPSANSLGSASNPIADVALADFDHDGWEDIVSVTEGAGINEVKLWQNPTMPFTIPWAVSNTLANSLSISITSVTVADLDVDGFTDLVIGGSDGEIRLWANPLTATAPFTNSWGAPFIAASASAGITDLAVADIDRDGRMDIVAVAGDTALMWRNPGNPFAASWTVSNTLGSLGNEAVSMVLDDLDNDGWTDVAVGDAVGNIILWRNPLTLTAPFTTSWGSDVDVADGAGAVNDLFAADLDNDGDVDLLSASNGSVQTWQNGGAPFSGTWASATPGSSTDTVFAVVAADVDHDGDVDITSGSGSNEDYEIILWPNALIHRDIPFEETGYVVGTLQDARFLDTVSVDLDGDGDLDLLTGSDSYTGYELIAWENNGTPFSAGWPHHNIGDLNKVCSIAVGDLDNDGDLDIVSGQSSAPRLLVWENDGTPFAGLWTSYSMGTSPTQVEDVAVGDLDNDGDLDIVAATGLDEWVASNDYKVTIWENDASPFTGTWNSSDVYTVTYSVHTVAVGDLDNDGWLDIVAGVNHAPAVGSSSNPAPPEDWYPNYELRAYQNDGTPFTEAWPETSVGRDPETATFGSGRYHGYWGATIFSVALADLDNDGDLDIVSGEHLEGDHQVKVWENDGTPFDGQPEEEHWTWQPTAAGVYAPWMSSSVYDVTTGDVNNDGYVDLITVSGEFYETLAWENDGRPFGAVITDTSWIRHNLGRYTSEGGLSVAVGDLDQDGDLDIVHGSGDYWSLAGNHDVVAWLNQSGSADENAVSTAPSQFLDGTADDVLGVSLAHDGILADHDIELAEWRLLLEESTGDPLTSAEANGIIENLYVYLDNGDSSWQPTDTPVLTVTNISLTDGVQPLSFSDNDPLVQVGPDDTPLNLFVVVQAASDASSHAPNTLVVTFDPDADSIVEDRTTDASVSIQDTVPTTTGIITFVGEPTQVTIEDLPTSSGNEVLTAMLGTGASLMVYANSHDAAGNFRESVAVTWSLTETLGGVASPDLVPAGDGCSAAFTADQIGAARIFADHSTLTDDATGSITVTLGVTVLPNPAPVGDAGGATVTAMLVNEDLTSVADGTVVTFTTDLGGFAGQTTVTRTTSGGVATATLTSSIIETAAVTVTGDTSQGWVVIDFIPGAPYTVTLAADPTSIVADGVSTSVISATVVDQYANLVMDGTVVTFTTDLGSFPMTFYTRTTAGGVATAVLTSSTRAGTSVVTATAGAAIGTAEISLLPGDPVTLTLSALSSQVSVDNAAVVTATLSDQYGNAVTDGTVVTFTTSLNLGDGSLSPEVGYTAGGVVTTTLTSTLTDSGLLAATATGGISNTAVITFTPGALAFFELSGCPSSIAAGDSFTDSVVVTAHDTYGNLKTDYVGAVYFTSTDLQATLPFTAGHVYSFTSSDAGQHSFVGYDFILRTTGTQSITVTDGTVTRSSGNLTVTPAALGSFQIAAPTEAASGVPFSVTVTAYDTESNLKTDYAGTVAFSSTDVLAVLPDDDGTDWMDGANSFTLTLTLLGSQVFTVTDGTVTQAAAVSVVTGAAATITLEDACDGTGNVMGDRILSAGNSLTICAIARDGVGNFVDNVAVSWSLVEKSGGVVDDDLTSAGDGKSASFTGREVGTARVQAVHTSLPVTTTGTLTVVPGVLDHFVLQVPSSGVAGQPFAMTVTARDQFGNTVTGFADDVSLSTSNGGIIIPTLVAGSAFEAGVWTGPVTLSEAGDEREVRVEANGVNATATIDLSPAEFLVFLPLVICGH